MKLIIAIVNDSDVKSVSESMMKGGFSLTKIGSSGGFLKSGMTTLISAVRNERLPSALDIIKLSTHSRKYDHSDVVIDASVMPKFDVPNEIVVGGATVFVLNIEETYKF